MPSTVPYSLVLVGLVLACSLAVLGSGETTAKPQDDPCFVIDNCPACVVTKTNTSVSEATGNGTCVWELTRTGNACVKAFLPSEGIIWRTYTVEGCKEQPNGTTTTTTSPPTTTKPTPTTTVTPPTSTNGTSTTTPASTTTPTSTTPSPASTNGTTTTTPTPPTNVTTTAAPPKPEPSKGGWWGPFIGGIVFAIAVASLAYLIWRFYKVRLDRNYHTFSNPTF